MRVVPLERCSAEPPHPGSTAAARTARLSATARVTSPLSARSQVGVTRRQSRDSLRDDVRLPMAHRIPREQVIWSFGPDLEPVLEFEPGETVTFETNDCFTGQIRSEDDL